MPYKLRHQFKNSKFNVIAVRLVTLVESKCVGHKMSGFASIYKRKCIGFRVCDEKILIYQYFLIQTQM